MVTRTWKEFVQSTKTRTINTCDLIVNAVKDNLFRKLDTPWVCWLRLLYLGVVGVALLYHAGDRIARVVERDSVFEVKTIDARGAPDVLICANNPTVEYVEGFYYTVFPLNGTSVPWGFSVFSPCNMSNTMLVFWTDYDRLKAQHDVADPKEEHPLDPDSDMMLEIHMKADNNTQDPIKFAVLHSGYNLFRDKRTFLPNSVSPDEFKTNLRFHTIQQFETAYMTPTTRVTKSLQDGIGGLFGRMDKNFHVDVSSIVDSSTSPQFARLIYNVPDTWEVHEEVLIMSIPEALASWGGVLSLAITIFNLTFGTRKISPVGFLQSRISRYSTIKKIEDEYSWDKKDQAAGGGGGGHQQGQGVPSSDSGSGSHHSRGKNVQNDNRPLSQVMGQGATMYSGNISHFEPEKRPLSQAFGPDTIIHVDNASQPEMGVPQPDSRSQMEYLIRRVKELENKVNMNESRASRFQEIVTDLYLDTSLIPQKFMDPLLRQHSTTNPHQAIGLTPTHTMDRQVSMAPQGTLNQPGMGMINSEVNTPVGTAQGPDTQAPQNRATRVQDWVHRFLKCNMGWPKN